MRHMQEFNQPEYYERRERQQRELSARATAPDNKNFHARLADHYGRLKEDILAMSRTADRQLIR